jgi:hypothetical protein
MGGYATLLRSFAGKGIQRLVVNLKGNLNGLTADLTVLDVLLTALFGNVQQHGNFFPAVRTFKTFLGFQFHGCPIKDRLSSKRQL